MLQLVHLNYVAIAVLLIVAGSLQIRNPKDRSSLALFVVVFLTLIEIFVNDLVLSLLCRTSTQRFDLYVYRTEQWFGLPSFHLGRLALVYPWFGNTIEIAYCLLPVAFLVLATASFLKLPLEEAAQLPWTVFYACLLVPLLYLIVPVAGPKYAISTFPFSAPPRIVPHVIYLGAIPNGVPSMHMTAALLFVYFARRWKIGLVLASIYAALTVCSTMATGEHYLLDLFAAVPYTALMIYVGGGRRLDVKSSKVAPAADSEISKETVEV
jgi:PAP2 superfamily